MPLNIESEIAGGVDAIKIKLAKLLTGFGGLNTAVLK
jgi:hypothetical protein